MDSNLSRTNGASKTPSPSTEFLAILKKHLAMFGELYRQRVSDLAIAAYAQDLMGLTPQQLDAACLQARRTSEFMPTSATILRCVPKQDNTFLGPAQIEYPPVTDDDRKAGEEFSAKLRETLTKMEELSAESKLLLAPVPLSPQFPVYHEAYLLWLKEQHEKDLQAEALGLSPLPRSEDERLAIFYNLPVQERNRLRRKAEWTKLNMNSTSKPTAGRSGARRT
jgi:hypothetical protein